MVQQDWSRPQDLDLPRIRELECKLDFTLWPQEPNWELWGGEVSAQPDSKRAALPSLTSWAFGEPCGIKVIPFSDFPEECISQRGEPRDLSAAGHWGLSQGR